MIAFKELINRVYRDKECVAFDYILKNDKGEEGLDVRFKKGNYDNEWVATIVLDRTRDADSQVYCFGYIMPKDNLPLTLIAATGLRYFQLYLKKEVETKVAYDFALSDVLRGM